MAFFLSPRIASRLVLLAFIVVLTACQGLTHAPEQVPARTLTVQPASLSFGSVVVGKSSSLNGSLNATGATVTVSSVTSTNAEFAVSGITFPAALAAGQSLPFVVVFTPSISGEASATLTFSSDAANSPTLESANGTGTALPQHRVDLSWDASRSPDVVGYNVYRGGTSKGRFDKINTTLEASTSYSDTLVTGNTTYFYYVTAVDNVGLESGQSNQVKAVVPGP